MKNIVVVGSQWGDEGKGKIVDWLSEQADVVIRFQGGHNAGHTLVIEGVTYKLRLLPSGIVRKNKISIIGNGVVVNPWALLDEISEIQLKGVEVSENNLIISDPMVFRGLLVKQVTFIPYRIDFENQIVEVYDDVEIEIEEYITDEIRNYSQNKLSRTFEPLYEDMIFN